MKKISLLACAMMLLFVTLAGCKQDVNEVEEVTTADVVSEAKDAGITFSANAQPVESTDVFKNNVMPELVASLSSLDVQSLLSVKSLKNAKGISAFRAAITEADLNNAIADLETQAETVGKNMEKLMSYGSCSGSIDWELPDGEFTVTDGIVLTINEAAIEASLSATLDSSTEVISGKGSGEIAVDAKAVANFKKAFDIDELPYAKLAVKANAEASGSMSGKDGPEEMDIDVNSYVGYSGAVVFNLENYAGVIKVDEEITVDADIDNSFIEKYSDLFSDDFDESSLNKAFFDGLPIEFSLTVSVYDIDGNKKFDFIDTDSLYEAYTKIYSLVETLID